eukprot:scaffold3691_cov394-Prasinococcus_capsulatus_cf.AAC.2
MANAMTSSNLDNQSTQTMEMVQTKMFRDTIALTLTSKRWIAHLLATRPIPDARKATTITANTWMVPRFNSFSSCAIMLATEIAVLWASERNAKEIKKRTSSGQCHKPDRALSWSFTPVRKANDTRGSQPLGRGLGSSLPGKISFLSNLAETMDGRSHSIPRMAKDSLYWYQSAKAEPTRTSSRYTGSEQRPRKIRLTARPA